MSVDEVKTSLEKKRETQIQVLNQNHNERKINPPKVAVINYSMGNVQSLINGLLKIGADAILTEDPDQLIEYDIWALPGVGAFPEGMQQLKKRNLIKRIKDHLDSGGGLIGICLGMQLLFDKSHEYGITDGLSLLRGEITKINTSFNSNKKLVLPHIGWNNLEKGFIKTNWLQDFVGVEQYFVHSYALESNLCKSDYEFLQTEYGSNKFVSAVKKDRIFGLQFHPERSGENGLKLLKNVIENL